VSIHVIPGEPAFTGGADALLAGGRRVEFGAWVAPNVVRTEAVLSFATTRPGPVRVDLHDAAGRRVRTLLDDARVEPGLHRILLDGRSDRGDRLESGLYFYRVQAAERTATGKIVFSR
jgi:hypothetical protein